MMDTRAVTDAEPESLHSLQNEARSMRPNRRLSLYINPRSVPADEVTPQVRLSGASDSIAGTDFP